MKSGETSTAYISRRKRWNVRHRRGPRRGPAWQAWPLEPMYPVVFFDALRVNIDDAATVHSKAVYLALAILPDGSRDVLIWIEQTEGANSG